MSKLSHDDQIDFEIDKFLSALQEVSEIKEFKEQIVDAIHKVAVS